ncbi:MAG TPA: septum formation inhibitor Maf, partial [Eubacterium sp.]|nr:septum formation inhibitor Maf [Eubacterium sp.]
KTDVYVDDITDKEIADYVATGDPLDKAGSYGIQGVFSKHIRKIDGDYFNVVGLPVNEIYRHLDGLLNWK